MRYHPLAIVLACGAGTASAQSTYEVPGDLSNLTTALNPSVTPVEAGDTIRLTDPLADLPGDFDPFHTGNFTVSIADLTIESVAGETVVIDGGNAGTVITVTEQGSGLTLRNVIIENGAAPGDGGGVHALAADLTVEDCLFRNNTAQDDGGAILSDQGALTIRRTRFENNHALGTGGSGDADGGAIFKFEGNLTIEGSDAGDPDTANSVFINNSSDDVGGAISAFDTNSVTITGTRFENNAATVLNGGGFHTNRAGSLTFDQCFFIDNTAGGSGGAVRLGNAEIAVTDCQVEGNSADGFDGGAISAVASGNGFIADSLFLYNTAGRHGGALLLRSSGIEINTSRFYANTAADFGGGIYAFGEIGGDDDEGGDEDENDVYNSLFVGNIAANGAAMAADSGPDPDLYNCTAVMNTCTFDTGQGAFVNIGGATAIRFNNCIVRNNVPISHDTNPINPLSFRSNNFEGLAALIDDVPAGNIDAEPYFVAMPDDGGDGFGDDPATPGIDESSNDFFGDLRLMPGSPSIDAGDATLLQEIDPIKFVGLDPLDLDGGARVRTAAGLGAGPATGVSVFGQFVDHGAFEVAAGIDADLNGDDMFDVFDLIDFIDLLESLQP